MRGKYQDGRPQVSSSSLDTCVDHASSCKVAIAFVSQWHSSLCLHIHLISCGCFHLFWHQSPWLCTKWRYVANMFSNKLFESVIESEGLSVQNDYRKWRTSWDGITTASKRHSVRSYHKALLWETVVMSFKVSCAGVKIWKIFLIGPPPVFQ